MCLVKDMGEVPPPEARMEFFGISQGGGSHIVRKRYLLSLKNVVLILMSSLKDTFISIGCKYPKE